MPEESATEKREIVMQYTEEPIDALVENIIESTDVLAKVLFAGFNIVFLVVLGVILITTLAMN